MDMGNPSGYHRRDDLVHHHLYPPTRAITTIPAHHRGMRTPIITREKREEDYGVGMMKYVMTINPFQTIFPLGDCHTMEVGGNCTTVNNIITMYPIGDTEGTRQSKILRYHLL